MRYRDRFARPAAHAAFRETAHRIAQGFDLLAKTEIHAPHFGPMQTYSSSTSSAGSHRLRDGYDPVRVSRGGQIGNGVARLSVAIYYRLTKFYFAMF